VGANLNLRHWFELLLCFSTSSAATEHKGDQTVTVGLVGMIIAVKPYTAILLWVQLCIL